MQLDQELIRTGHFKNPNVIDGHGRILTNGDSHDAVQRGFLRSFNITRTEKLLSWFRARALGKAH